MIDKYETRSVSDTATETAAWSGGVILFLAVLMSTSFNNGDANFLDRTAGVGEIIYPHLGWALTIYITVLLAFYAVSFGGQVLGSKEIAAQIRAKLGFTAQLIATATVVLVYFIAAYCVKEPKMSAILVVVVPMVAIIMFLVLQLGTFFVVERGVRYENASRAREEALARLQKLKRFSHRPFLPVWLWGATATTGVSFLLSLLPGFLNASNSQPPGSYSLVAVRMVLLLFVLALVLLGVSIFVWYRFLTSEEPVERVLIWVLLLGHVSFAIVVPSLVRSPAPLEALFGGGLGAVVALVLAATFWPRAVGSQRSLDWSVQGAAARLAVESSKKKYANANRECKKLSAVSPPEKGLAARLRAALQVLTSSS